MKGLVYQGHSGGDDAAPKPVELYPDGQEAEPKGEKEKGKKGEPAMSAESSTILNFTESDNKFRTIAILVGGDNSHSGDSYTLSSTPRAWAAR